MHGDCTGQWRTRGGANRGLAEADQPLITFLDADDRFVPEKLEAQLQVLAENARRDAVHLPRLRLLVARYAGCGPEVNGASSPQLRPGQVATWLVRRELFERVGTFNASRNFHFAEGSELYSRIENAGVAVVRIDDVLLERRLHASNKTTDPRRTGRNHGADEAPAGAAEEFGMSPQRSCRA